MPLDFSKYGVLDFSEHAVPVDEDESKPMFTDLSGGMPLRITQPTTIPRLGPTSTISGGPRLAVDFNTDFRGPTQTLSDALSEAYGIGTGSPSESLLGIRPEVIPSGQKITEETGIPRLLTVPASAIAKAGAGLGQFLTSVGGGVEVGTAGIPGVGLLQKAKWIYDMAKGAGESTGDLSAKLEMAAKNPEGMKGEDWQTIADDAANSALMLYGSGKLSSHEFSKLTGVRAPIGRMLESEKTRVSKDVAEELKKSEFTPTEQTVESIRRLGATVPIGPFAQPGVLELADAALAERMNPIVVPGRENAALNALRHAVEPSQIVPVTTARAERVAGGGEAPYGKVSYMREAEAPLPESAQVAPTTPPVGQTEIVIQAEPPEAKVEAKPAQSPPSVQPKPYTYETVWEDIQNGTANVPDSVVKDFLGFREAWEEWARRRAGAKTKEEERALDNEGLDRFGDYSGMPQLAWGKAQDQGLKWDANAKRWKARVESKPEVVAETAPVEAPVIAPSLVDPWKMSKDQLVARGYHPTYLQDGTLIQILDKDGNEVPKTTAPEPAKPPLSEPGRAAVAGEEGQPGTVTAAPGTASQKAPISEAKPEAGGLQEPWRMTRGEVSRHANIQAKLAKDLPPQAPSEYWVLKAVSDKANRKPYDPYLLQGQGMIAMKKAGFVSGVKNLKLTDRGRNQLNDWARDQRDYDLAYGTLADEAIDAALDAHKASIEKALQEGKPVPPEVLADYPDLAKPTPPQAPGKAGETGQGATGGEAAKPIPVWNVSYVDLEARNSHRPFFNQTALSAGNTRKEAIERVQAMFGAPKYGEFRASKAPAGTKADYHFEAPKAEPKPAPTPGKGGEKEQGAAGGEKLPDVELVYHAPATGKKSRWIRKNGLWYKSKNLTGDPVLQKTPLESGIGLARALDQQAANPKEWQRVRVLTPETATPTPQPSTAKVETPIPPRSLPAYGIDSRAEARRYGLPDDFYYEGSINPDYLTPEYERAVSEEAKWRNNQGSNATTGRRMARERTGAAFLELVQKARQKVSAQPATKPAAKVETPAAKVEAEVKQGEGPFDHELAPERPEPLGDNANQLMDAAQAAIDEAEHVAEPLWESYQKAERELSSARRTYNDEKIAKAERKSEKKKAAWEAADEVTTQKKRVLWDLEERAGWDKADPFNKWVWRMTEAWGKMPKGPERDAFEQKLLAEINKEWIRATGELMGDASKGGSAVSTIGTLDRSVLARPLDKSNQISNISRTAKRLYEQDAARAKAEDEVAKMGLSPYDRPSFKDTDSVEEIARKLELAREKSKVANAAKLKQEREDKKRAESEAAEERANIKKWSDAGTLQWSSWGSESGVQRWKAVEGKEVKIEAAPDHKFFVWKNGEQWIVVESSSGKSVGKSGTRKGAIAEANSGIAGFNERMATKGRSFADVVAESAKEMPPKPATPEAIGGETRPGLITGTGIDKWADDVLRGGATHLAPEVFAAYLVRGASLIERGIRDFAAWSARMVEMYGPAIEPHLKSIFDAAGNTLKRAPITESGTLKSARQIVEQRLGMASATGQTSRQTQAVAQPQPATTGTTPTPTATIPPTAATPVAPTAAVPSGPVLDDIYRIFEPEKKPSTPLRQRASDIIESFRTGFSSKFRPVNKLAEDIAKAYGLRTRKDIAGIMEQLKGSRGKGEADIYRFDRAVSDLVKGQEKDFNAYMFLRRSLDRLRQDQNDPNKRRAVAGYTIPVLEAKLATLEGKLGNDLPRFQQAANAYQTHLDNALRLQVESGRMSQEVYNQIKSENQFYAPFKVMKWLEEGMRPEGTGRKVDTVADYTKAMEGIEDPNFKLGDMLAAGRQNILISRILADKAVAMRHVSDLANVDFQGLFIRKLFPTQEVARGWNAVNVFENGKKTRYAVRPEVADALQLYGTNADSFLIRFMGALAVPFKAGATALNIPFQVSNLLADVPRQALVSKYGLRGVNDLVRYPLDFVHALYSSMVGDMVGTKNKLFLDFLDSGAAQTTIQEHLTPQALRYRDPATMSSAKRIGLGILYAPAEFAAAIEQTSKILGVKRAMRFEGVTSGKELAKQIPDAVTEIRRFSGSPDFGRQGKWTETARLNLLFMFLNARIQGAVADVGRLTGRDGWRRAAITWMRVGSAIGVPTAYLYALNNSPEYKADYDKIPQQNKDNYWHIPKDTFITNEDGEKMRDYWRIPKRESAKWIANIGESAMDFAQKRNPQAFVNFSQRLLEDISPVNIQGNNAQERLESVASGLNPVIKAPLEVATGREMYRHRDLVPDTMKKASPEMQFTDRTSEAFKKLAVAMPDVAFEFLRSPLMLENITRNLTAGLITQFLGGKPVEGRSELANLPLLQRFQRTPYTDNEAFTKEIQGLERESADEYLTRHRTATDIMQKNKGAPLATLIKIAGKDRDVKLMQQVVDLWSAERNGATRQDRQLIALAPKQRAEYLAKVFSGMTPEAKRKAIVDLAKKRVLTEAVFMELPNAITQLRKD